MTNTVKSIMAFLLSFLITFTVLVVFGEFVNKYIIVLGVAFAVTVFLTILQKLSKGLQ